MKDIPLEHVEAEFIRIKNTTSFAYDEEEDKERLSRASHSHRKIKYIFQKYLLSTTRNMEEDPNKLMTMKVADKMLTVMMTEDSKNKRVIQ